MADVIVSELSDADLRKKLLSFGHNVGPVTSSTRGIFEKKLAKSLAATPALNGNGVSTQDDVVVTKSNRLPRGRRSLSRKFAPLSSDEEDVSHTSEPYKKSETNNISDNKSESGKNEFVDPNDILISPLNSTYTINNKSSSQNRRVSSHTCLPPSPLVSKSITVPSSDISTSTATTTTNHKSPYEMSYKDEFSDDDFSFPTATSKVNNISSSKDVTTDSNTVTHRIGNRKPSGPTPVGKDESIKLTPATRYSSLSKNSSKLGVSNIDNEKMNTLKQLRKSYTSKRPSPNAKREDIAVVHEIDDDEEIDAEFVPEISYMEMLKNSVTWFRIFLLIIVFLLIGLYIYNGDNNDIPSIEGSDSGSDKLKHYRIINCLYQKMSILAGDAECGYVKDKWVKNSSLSAFAKSCLQGNDILGKLNFSTYSDFFVTNEDGDVCSKFAYRSLGCRINQAISVVMMRVIITVITITCILVGYFIMKKRWAEDDEQTQQILHFVERIIETLQRHHEICQTNKDLPPFLPIPHVRDMLIPLAKRKQMAKTWRKAVAFLNSSDSRVRVETQRIAGEDFDVWKWIGVSTLKLKKGKKATNETYLSNDDHKKCWQGPAFDAIEKVVRMPIVTPTPCLKIRYMHEGSDEKGVNWKKRVENAVLEKCNQDSAQILHIYVDSASKEGCVYVKCDSLESAGKAFRCMYGNWFDSRLVIVKFVTLARYHQRFPEALKCVTPLQSDKELPSSLNWVSDE